MGTGGDHRVVVDVGGFDPRSASLFERDLGGLFRLFDLGQGSLKLEQLGNRADRIEGLIITQPLNGLDRDVIAGKGGWRNRSQMASQGRCPFL